jgi:hypothetical protein
MKDSRGSDHEATLIRGWGARPGVDYGSAGLSELRDTVRWRVSSRSGEVLLQRYGGNVGILRIGHEEANVKYERPLFLLCSQQVFFNWGIRRCNESYSRDRETKFHLVFVAPLNVVGDLNTTTLYDSDSLLEYTIFFSFEFPQIASNFHVPGPCIKRR